MLTPHCSAASGMGAPPLIVSTTRLRKSSEYGFAIHAGLLPVGSLNQIRAGMGIPDSAFSGNALAGLRGRDASYLAPPAQIRTCGFPAYGSHLGYRRQQVAVCEPTPCVTLTRLRVRRVLSWPAFSSVPALRSTNSAADRSALFVGFTLLWQGQTS